MPAPEPRRRGRPRAPVLAPVPVVTPRDLAAWLARVGRARGLPGPLPQRALARLLGVEGSTVSRWLAGTVAVPATVAWALPALEATLTTAPMARRRGRGRGGQQSPARTVSHSRGSSP